MPQPPKKLTLTCGQCGFENEPERVYCHNCGTKLDRSILPKENTSPEEALAETRRRVRKMTSPGSAWTEVKTGLNTLVWAALVASLYLALSPPSRPPLPKDQEMGANLISVLIDDALTASTASVLTFSEADISQHMRSRVRSGEVVPFLEFKRSYGLLGDGKVIVGVQQDLFGWPLYSSVEYRLKVVDGQFTAVKTGQWFGRLGLDPRIPKVDNIFKPIWAGLKREAPLKDRMQAIQITPQRMTIALKAGTPTQ